MTKASLTLKPDRCGKMKTTKWGEIGIERIFKELSI
jgi:hypothetical protein